MTRTVLGLLTVVLLGACAGPTHQPPPSYESVPPGDFPTERYRGRPPGTVYRISRSSLTLRVYRAGRLRQFGHNHVITSSGLGGLIYLPVNDDAVSAARADLYLAVTTLVVDDPEERGRAGEEFTAPVPMADRDGTRNNLLGPRVLDAQHHPYLQIAVTPRSAAVARLQVAFKGDDYEMLVPLTWSRSNGKLAASSRFTVSHESIGLTPFSILGGAISVAEGIEVSLHLEAVFTSLSQPRS